jgi:hypothetical protein
MGCFLGLQDPVELPGTIDLVPYRRPTVLTAVFIFVPLGEDQEQRLPYLDRPAAFGAIEFGRFELIKLGPVLCGGAGATRSITERHLSHKRNLCISTTNYAKSIDS